MAKSDTGHTTQTVSTYSTRRMNFAATLLALGFDLCDVKRGQRGELSFYFHDDGEMASRYECFLTGKLQVSVLKFIRAQDTLRDLCREHQGGDSR